MVDFTPAVVIKKAFILCTFFLAACVSMSQEIRVKVMLEGKSTGTTSAFIDHSIASFEADASGMILISPISLGKHDITIFHEGFASQTITMNAEMNAKPVQVTLRPIQKTLEEISIESSNHSGNGMANMRYIELDGIYAAKKNEIVVPSELPMNQSSNNGRQLFSKVAGVNVQEIDAGGLQLSIGARGLDPNRTSNFNTRQDGYDISADALGYPESYYTPPIEAVEQVELIRGAASLQYGTQFGGLLNFKMKRGNLDKPLEFVGRQTIGSYGFNGSFASIGGSTGKWNYYGFAQHKQGNSWRPNSAFQSYTGYAQASRNLNNRWSIDLAITHHEYLAKQPGGLTDRMFEENASQSIRDRNWFSIDWNLAAITLHAKINPMLNLTFKTFGLKAERQALGFLGNITRVDTLGKRDLIKGSFFNVGNECRLLQRFNLNSLPGAVLLGTRLYSGNTRNQQGLASDLADADFRFKHPENLEGSDYRFPSQNLSVFSEALIPVSKKWLITPGMRFEFIKTSNEGYYRMTNRHPLTNEVLYSANVQDASSFSRKLLLMGLGSSYRPAENMEVYTNFSQNYRAINFSDIRVNNPSLVVDSNLQDERGFTLDVGMRAKWLHDAITLDASGFLINYQNRIGEVLQADKQGRLIRLRTNIADAQFLGVECFEEINLVKLFDANARWSLLWFNNAALIRARYVKSEGTTFENKRVENVPALNYKTGVSISANGFGAGYQLVHVSSQYTDASNADFFADATAGLIPAYTVSDISANYTWQRFRLEMSINNLADKLYFTRRATGYPGPGIIPAERRMVFVTLEVKI